MARDLSACAALATALLFHGQGSWSRAALPARPSGREGEVRPRKGDRLAARKPRFSLVIEGEEPPRPTATWRRVDARTLSLLPRRSGDDLLRLVPGLYLSRHGAEGKGTQIFLRGFDAAHGSDVEVLLSGIPMNELSNIHGQGYLDLGPLLPEAVLSMDAIKGSFLADQGPFATAGSVRFQLGVPAELRGTRASYEAGSTSRQRIVLLLAPRALPQETFLAAEALHDEGYGVNREAERLNLLGQARLFERAERRGGRLRLVGLLSAYAARFGTPAPVPLVDHESGRLSFYDTPSRDTRGTSHRALASLRLLRDGEQEHLEVLLHGGWRRLVLEENFTGHLLYTDRGDARRQHHRAVGGGLRLRYERRLLASLTLRGGAGLMLESLGQHEDQIDKEQRPWQRNRDLDALQVVAGVHAALDISPWPWLRLGAGARLDLFHFRTADRLDARRSGADTFAKLSPRMSLLFPLPRSLSLALAYGQGVRPPEARAVTGVSFADRVIEVMELSEYGGRAAGLTTSDTVEAGLRYRAGRVFEIGAAGFGTWVDNELLFDHVAATSVALKSTRRLGADLEVRVDPLPWLRLRADMTFVDARFVESGAKVPLVPRFLGTLTGTFFHPSGWRAGLRILGLAPRDLRYGAVSGGAVIIDITLGCRIGRVQVDLFIDNLLNARWREGEYHYASHFNRDQERSQLPSIHYSAGPPLTVRGVLTLWL